VPDHPLRVCLAAVSARLRPHGHAGSL